MRDLSKIYREVGGHRIATVAEIQSLAYGVPEGDFLPAVFSEFAAGSKVEPAELYACLMDGCIEAARESETALEMIRLFAARLRSAFSDEELLRVGRATK